MIAVGLLSPTFALGIQFANHYSSSSSSSLGIKIKIPSTHQYRCFNPNLLKKRAPICPQLRAVADLCGPITKQTDFSLSFANHAISSTIVNKDTNFVISTISVHIGLSMITAGSVGPTRDQLLEYLRSESVTELNSLSSALATRILADGLPLCGPNLTFVNGVWVDSSLPLKPAFKGFFNDDFKVFVKDNVDFRTKANKAREQVKEWAYRKTESLVGELIPFGSVNSHTKLLLVNTLYFRGFWDDDQFYISVTRNHSFFLKNEKLVQVPFMSSWENQYVRVFDDFRVATLPYKKGFDSGREFLMHIFLPNANGILPLHDLVERESAQALDLSNTISNANE